MKRVIYTANAPEPVGPYSQAVALGDFLFCSGQVAIDPKTNQVFTGDIKTQTQMVMKNIENVLRANDMNFSHVVKTTIFLTNMADFTTVNEVYATYFTGKFPARSTVAVAGLPKGVNVEIEIVAHRA